MQPVDQHDQPVGYLGIDLADRAGRVVAKSFQHAHRRRRSKRSVAGEHCVKDAAQAEQVCPLVNCVAVGLFRSHVLRRPGDDSALSETRIVHRASQPEVRNANSRDAVLQQDVRRFDVSMYDALRVSRRQSLSNLLRNSHGFANFQRTVAVNASFQRLALHILHDDKRRRFFNGVNRDNVFVANARRRSPFSNKPLPSLTVPCQMRSKQLDRNDSPQRPVKRFQHDAHAASASDSQNVVVLEPTDRAGFGRRIDERKLQLDRFAHLLGVFRRLLLQLFNNPLQARTGGFVARKFFRCRFPEISVSDNLQQRVLADIATFQMELQAVGLAVRKRAVDQSAQGSCRRAGRCHQSDSPPLSNGGHSPPRFKLVGDTHPTEQPVQPSHQTLSRNLKIFQPRRSENQATENTEPSKKLSS